MKNKKSFFIALGLLVAPILVYWVLSLGTHKFETLPFYGERIPPEGANKDTIYYTVPDFKLVSQFGDTVTQATIGKRIYIANFFFARCKDVCPKMNAKVETIYAKCNELASKKKEYAEILFVSHSVDPENDSVPVLAYYAERFGVKNRNWLFLTGSKEAMFNAGQGYLLPVSIEDKTIDHSQQLLLIDRDKHIRGIYDGLDDTEIKRLREDIDVLLNEHNTK
ncbi:MAG: SCO family protein [Bacteroidota bacterium]